MFSLNLTFHYRQVECFTLHLMNVQKCLFVCVYKACRSPQNMLSNVDLTMTGFWTSEWQRCAATVNMPYFTLDKSAPFAPTNSTGPGVLEDWEMIHMACLMCVIGSCINVCVYVIPVSRPRPLLSHRKTLESLHLSWGRRWRPELLFFCQICRDYLQHDPISWGEMWLFKMDLWKKKKKVI